MLCLDFYKVVYCEIGFEAVFLILKNTYSFMVRGEVHKREKNKYFLKRHFSKNVGNNVAVF